MTTLASIITADKQHELTLGLRGDEQDRWLWGEEAADTIDGLVNFARDLIYDLDELYRAASNFQTQEDMEHQIYPDTDRLREAREKLTRVLEGIRDGL